jgi:hypothetical protein
MRKYAAIIILIVFTFGLVPGEYWIKLHPHHHDQQSHLAGVTISKTAKICTSQTHLYDYTKELSFEGIFEVSYFQIITLPYEKHFPHPSFLNIPLRAPPSVKVS